VCTITYLFFFSSRRRHTRSKRDWSSDVCSSDLAWMFPAGIATLIFGAVGMLAAHQTQRMASYCIVLSSGTLLAALGMPGVILTRSGERRVGRARHSEVRRGERGIDRGLSGRGLA